MKWWEMSPTLLVGTCSLLQVTLQFYSTKREVSWFLLHLSDSFDKCRLHFFFTSCPINNNNNKKNMDPKEMVAEFESFCAEKNFLLFNLNMFEIVLDRIQFASSQSWNQSVWFLQRSDTTNIMLWCIVSKPTNILKAVQIISTLPPIMNMKPHTLCMRVKPCQAAF